MKEKKIMEKELKEKTKKLNNLEEEFSK